MAQRLVRAKRKIRAAGIRFEPPAVNVLAGRLAGVQGVIYLVFNEGYAATGGVQLVRVDLCAEAIWLGSVLHRLLPDNAETAGLLALMLLNHSHAAARQDDAGRPVPLAEQSPRPLSATGWAGAVSTSAACWPSRSPRARARWRPARAASSRPARFKESAPRSSPRSA
ncbi:MAG TPA: DUF6596 domain-containing protein [Streptosporangiaceae bacterium]|nr:DUF6596 domain-containing protein [Streptosporangiaceae bacterium]